MEKIIAWVAYNLPELDSKNLEMLNKGNFCPEELREPFSGISFFDPDLKWFTFEPIDCCKDVQRHDREVTFEIFEPKETGFVFEGGYCSTSPSTRFIIDSMKEVGLRPALFEELIGFVKGKDHYFGGYSSGLVALGTRFNCRSGSKGYLYLRTSHDLSVDLEARAFRDSKLMEEKWSSIVEPFSAHFRFLGVRE